MKEREVIPEQCPTCGVMGSVESYGEHPVYLAPNQPPPDLQVVVLICRECRHVQLRQIV